MTETDETPPPRKKRSLLRIAAWIAGGFLLLLIAIFAGARIYLSDARLTELAPKLLSDELTGEFQIGSIDWEFPRTVIVRDAVVTDPKGIKVIEAKYVKASVVLSPLIYFDINIVDVSARDVIIRPLTIADAFLPANPGPETQSDPPRVKVSADLLENISVFIDDPEFAVAATKITVRDGYFSFSKENMQTSASLNIEDIKVRKKQPGPDVVEELGPISMKLESAKLTQTFDNNEMEVEVGGAKIAGLSSAIDISGSVEGLPLNPRGKASGKISMSLDDPQLLALLPAAVKEQLTPKGQLTIDFTGEGSAEEGEAKLELTGNELMLAGSKVKGLLVRAEMEKNEVLLDQVFLSLEQGRVDVRGKIGLTAELPHELEVHAENIPVRSVVAHWTDPQYLPLVANATVTLSGESLVGPSSRAVFEVSAAGIPRNLTQGLVSEAVARGTADIRPDHAILEPVFVAGGGISATLRGKIPFDTEQRMSVRVEAKDTRGTAHLERLGAPLSVKTVTLSAKVGGTYLSPEVDGELVATAVEMPDLPRAELRAPVKMAKGVVSVDGAVVELAGGRANITATARVLEENGEPVAEPMIDGTVTLAELELGPFTQENIEGRVSGNATFRGTPNDYLAHAELDLGAIRTVGTTVAVSRIVVDGDENTLTLSPLRIVPETGGVILAEGTVNTKEGSFAALVRGKDIPAELIGAVSPEMPEFSGTIGLAARAEGPFVKPAITGTASASGFEIDGISIGRIQADVSTELETVHAKVSIGGEAGNLQAEGSLRLADLAVDARIKAIDLDVRKLPAIDTAELSLEGMAGVDLYIKGNLPLPRVNGTIGIRGLRMEEQPVGDGRVELSLKTEESGKYLLDGKALGALTVKAALVPVENPPEGYLPVRGEAVVEIAELQVADVVPSLAANSVSVITAGRAELDIGKSEVPVTGKLSLTKMEARFSEETLSASKDIVVRWDGKELILDQLVLAGTTGQFEAAGRVGETIDLRADGEIEMAFIEPFVRQIARASGKIKLTARVQGTSDDPQIQGSIALVSPATIRPRGGLREITLDAASISLVPGRVTIDKLQGGMSGGTFSLSGDLGLNGFTPNRWNIRFEGSNLPYRNPEVLVEVDANLRIVGDSEVPRILGDVEIVRGRYLKKFRLEQFVFVQRTSALEDDYEEEEPSPFLTDLELNIHARSVGEISVKVDAQAFATEMDLTADIFIRGTAANPRVEGQVLSESGTLSFPATELEIERAEITFQPTLSQGIRPVIDLLASGEVNANPSGAEGRPTPFDVQVRIEGPVEAMKLELTSQPALPQDQVLSLVVLGQVDPTMLVEGSETKGSGTIESSLVFAGSQLATPVTRFVEKQLEKQLNLQLTIGTEVSSERFRLTAARELTSRFRIEGGYERLFTESAGMTTGRALLFISNRVFVEGMAQNTTLGAGSTSTLEEGLSSSLELKLRLMGD